MVSFEQAGAEHMLLSQLLIGSITELFWEPVTRGRRVPGLRQVETSGLAAAWTKVEVHWSESLNK